MADECSELRKRCLDRGITEEQLSGRFSLESLTELADRLVLPQSGPEEEEECPGEAEDASDDAELTATLTPVLHIFEKLSEGTGFLSKQELQRALGTNFLARKYMQKMTPSKHGITKAEWRRYFADASLSSAQMEQMQREFHTDLVPGALVGGRFKLKHALGQGSFGKVFLAADEEEPGLGDCALKFEWGNTTEQLKREIGRLQQCASVRGVVNLRWSGDAMGCRVLAMQLLGPDMYEAAPHLLYRNRDHLTQIFADTWTILKDLHTLGLVHRDVKPHNWCLSREPRKPGSLRVSLVDFGLSGELGQCNKPVGTPVFKSLFCHKQHPASFLDDIWGNFYSVAAFALQSGLPWCDFRETIPVGKRSSEVIDAVLHKSKEDTHQSWLDDPQLLGPTLSEAFAYLTTLFPGDELNYDLLRCKGLV